MRVFQLQDEWSIDNLTLAERPDPEPGHGQALLRMKAASLNYRDLIVTQRGYGRYTGELPLIPLSDGVGEVVALGPGVTRVAVGDRVCPIFNQSWISGPPSAEHAGGTLGGPLDGVMADTMAVSAQGLVKVPDYLGDEEAATLPCAAVTAWSALISQGEVKPGDRVLVQGTGGVSLFALQFAKLLGAEVIVTSSSDEKLERAMALGADHGINYRTNPEWGKAALAITNGEGVDHIVEVGGEATLPESLRAIRPGGHISIIGVLSGGTMNARIGLLVMRAARLQGITVGNRDGFEAMARALAQHRLKPVIDEVFGFAELRAAMDRLAEGGHFGKICINFGA